MKLNKILLIRPDNELPKKIGSFSPPLGLIYIASTLKEKGYKIKIIDAQCEKDYEKKILEHAKDSLIVGISILSIDVKSAYKITKIIKSNINVPIVWGGWHATLFPEQIIKNKLIDFVITGEGEYKFLRLVESLKGKKNIKNIPGLLFKKRGKIYWNKDKEEYINLDDLPRPDFSLVDVDNYINQNIGGKVGRTLHLFTSRGCPYQCTFCCNPITNNRKFRAVSAKKVVDEIEYLVKQYDLRFIYFADDNFFLNPERVRKICQEMLDRKLNIKWFAQCRVDYLKSNHLGRDLLILAKMAGLDDLTFGIESGSELILKKIKKGITLEEIYNAAKLCNDYDIRAEFSIIIGFPRETKKDLYKTIDMILRLKKICPNSIFSLTTFMLYPKTEITQNLIKQGYFKEPESLEEWCGGASNLYMGYTECYAPWLKDPELVKNVFYYVLLYTNSCPQKIESKHLIYLFFRFLTKKRLKNKFFYFNLDKWIYNSVLYLYHKLEVKKVNLENNR